MGKKNENWLLNDFLGILLGIVLIICLFNNYDLLQRVPENRGSHIGSELFVVIDYIGGKKWVFLCLISIIIFYVIDILKKYPQKQSKLQIIVRYSNRVFALWAIFIYIIIPFYAIIKLNNYKKDIANSGIETIVFVSEINDGSEYKNTYDATLLYYVKDRLIKRNWSGIKRNQLYDFYILKYLPENNRKINIDFNKKVPIDSIYKYFPIGKNPFEAEIKKLEERKDVYILDMDSIVNH